MLPTWVTVVIPSSLGPSPRFGVPSTGKADDTLPRAECAKSVAIPKRRQIVTSDRRR
jgi:hypothetical protein